MQGRKLKLKIEDFEAASTNEDKLQTGHSSKTNQHWKGKE